MRDQIERCGVVSDPEVEAFEQWLWSMGCKNLASIDEASIIALGRAFEARQLIKEQRETVSQSRWQRLKMWLSSWFGQ